LDEHANVHRTTIAIDSGGQVYLLKSPADIRFMTRQHPPQKLTSSGVVDYSVALLEMMGRIGNNDIIVRRASDVSSEHLARAGIAADDLIVSHISGETALDFVAWVTVRSEQRIHSFKVYVDRTGFFSIMTE